MLSCCFMRDYNASMCWQFCNRIASKQSWLCTLMYKPGEGVDRPRNWSQTLYSKAPGVWPSWSTDGRAGDTSLLVSSGGDGDRNLDGDLDLGESCCHFSSCCGDLALGILGPAFLPGDLARGVWGLLLSSGDIDGVEEDPYFPEWISSAYVYSQPSSSAE